MTSANVGQLAVDLIITTLHLPCVGQLETTCLLPCAGIGAFDHLSQRVSLGLELFECPVAQGPPVFVLQQRAPAARGCQQKFAKELAEWASGCAFAEVSCCDVTYGSIHAAMCNGKCAASRLLQVHSERSPAAAVILSTALCLVGMRLCMLTCGYTVCMQVVVIASLDANLRHDRQIAAHQVNYHTSESAAAEVCQHLGWDQLEVSIFRCSWISL